MKIGLDISQTCAERAGCAWYADSLARAMISIAPTQQFLLYHQFAGWINETTEKGTHVEAPNVACPFDKVPPQEARKIWASQGLLGKYLGAPDIIHAMSYQAPKVHGSKLVFTVYDLSFWQVPEFTTEENRLACEAGILHAMRNADGLIFISESMLHEFNKLFPDWLSSHHMPHIAIPLAPRFQVIDSKKESPKADHEYWLAVGSLEPRKNYETIFSAYEQYAKMSKKPAPLWIAGGEGWRGEKIKARISELQKTGRVRRLGYVPDEQMPSLMAGAKALLFPSWYEGFGLPVVEALACGCPVICSNTTSLPEAGGSAARYVAPGDAAGIAKEMLEIERVPADVKKRKLAGTQHVSKFSWATCAEKTLAFYQEVVSNHK